ncbi:hypothetical protein AA0X95_05480 [Bacillus sp. 1P10SD]|uniref:hypothetical protein n=1 Tax=Bacillus sp. 1P10SD TaxID=3132265 RepID=UPI0039A5C657
MIKNLDIITDQTKSFSMHSDIKFIVGFFLSFQSEFSEGSSVLDIEFLIEVDERQYVTRIRFYNPDSIKFESGGPFHQIDLDIHDIRDRGWEEKKYEVIDYEESTLHFYCSEIEVIFIKETHYFI